MTTLQCLDILGWATGGHPAWKRLL